MSKINDVYEFLKGKVFYPATIGEDGKPKVRPFGAVAFHEGKIYICTNSQKNVSKELKNGFLEIAATAENGDWIRIATKAVFDPDEKAKEQVFSENPQLKDIYAGREQLFEVFYLSGGTATLSSIAGEIIWSVDIE